MPASTSGKPCAPLGPGLEPPLGVRPGEAAVALLELLASVAGEGVQDVVVEVTPAQLTAKRARPPALGGQAILELARRDAP